MCEEKNPSKEDNYCFQKARHFPVAGRAAVQPIHYSFISSYKSLLYRVLNLPSSYSTLLRFRSQTAGPSFFSCASRYQRLKSKRTDETIFCYLPHASVAFVCTRCHVQVKITACRQMRRKAGGCQAALAVKALSQPNPYTVHTHSYTLIWEASGVWYLTHFFLRL